MLQETKMREKTKENNITHNNYNRIKNQTEEVRFNSISYLKL